MSDSTFIFVNLPIVSAFVCLVAEEMDSGVIGTGDIFLRSNVLQAVGFVPADGEDVEGDLAANGVTAMRKRK